MITHKFKRGITIGGTLSEFVFNVQAGGERLLDQSVSDGASNLALAFALTVSRVQSFFIVSDQPITVKTNSSGSPGNVFALQADIPLQYVTGVDPAWRDPAGTLVIDITSLFVSNASGHNARLQIFALYTPT